MSEERIDVWFKEESSDLLRDWDYFLHIAHYSKHDLVQPYEFGKVELIDGPSIHFHRLTSKVNANVLRNVLEDIYFEMQSQPNSGIKNLKKIIDFLRRNT